MKQNLKVISTLLLSSILAVGGIGVFSKDALADNTCAFNLNFDANPKTVQPNQQITLSYLVTVKNLDSTGNCIPSIGAQNANLSGFTVVVWTSTLSPFSTQSFAKAHSFNFQKGNSGPYTATDRITAQSLGYNDQFYFQAGLNSQPNENDYGALVRMETTSGEVDMLVSSSAPSGGGITVNVPSTATSGGSLNITYGGSIPTGATGTIFVNDPTHFVDFFAGGNTIPVTAQNGFNLSGSNTINIIIKDASGNKIYTGNSSVTVGTSASGAKANGITCSDSSECQSNFCTNETGKCEACTGDSDCNSSGDTGFACSAGVCVKAAAQTQPGSGSSAGVPNTSLSVNLYNPLPEDTLVKTFLVLAQGFLAVLGVFSVVFIIIGGFQMVVGSGNEEAYTKGKKTIIWAVLGLVFALLSFSIIAIVEDVLQANIPAPTSQVVQQVDKL